MSEETHVHDPDEIYSEQGISIGWFNKIANSPLRKPLALICVIAIIMVIVILLIMAFIRPDINSSALTTIQNLCFALIFPPMGYIFSSTIECNKDKAVTISNNKLYEKHPELSKEYNEWQQKYNNPTNNTSDVNMNKDNKKD